MKKIFNFLLITFILSGCGTIQVNKRHYTKGFDIQWSKKFYAASTTSEEQPELCSEKPEFKSKETKQDQLAVAIEREVKNLEDVKFTELPQPKHIEQTVEPKKSEIPDEQPLSVQQTQKQEDVSTQQNARSNESFETSNVEPFVLLSILLLPFAFASMGTNQRIAQWAKEQKSKARWMITVLTILGLLTALALGTIVRFPFTPFTIALSVGGMILSLLIHSAYRNNPIKKTRQQGKLFSFTLLRASGLISAFSLGGTGMLTDPTKLLSWDFIHGITDMQTASKEPLVHHPALIILLTLLGILVIAGILYLTVIASCNIACNGNEAMAVFVLIFGIFLAAFLGSLIISFAFKREGETDMVQKSMVPTFILSGILLLTVLVFAILG